MTKPEVPVTGQGLPLQVPLAAVFEDPNNPRTEFPESEMAELVEDIRCNGILQPIVVHPADERGRYRIHFGAKRFRAATKAGLLEVPVTVRQADADPYAQVAENQKRHALSPLDMARFIRSRVDLGESNATISGRLGMDLTTVAHHLALLALPGPLEAALRSGRCVAPRTLYELSKVHAERPEAVVEMLEGEKPITREAVAALRRPAKRPRQPRRTASRPAKVAQKPTTPASLATRAEQLCLQLGAACSKLREAGLQDLEAERLTALRTRVNELRGLLDA